MKKTKEITAKGVIFMISLVLSLPLLSCRPEEAVVPDPLQEQREALMNHENAWVLDSQNGVMKDGLDVTDQFTGFQLNFGASTFNTKNSLSSAWPANGTWSFHNANPEEVMRSDGVIVNVGLSTDGLVLRFSVDAPSPNGRHKSVSGEYTFHLTSE